MEEEVDCVLFTGAVGFSSAEEGSTAPCCRDQEQLRGVAATGSYCWWVDDVVLDTAAFILHPSPTHPFVHAHR